jgi:uncharacterized membrane protein YgcG
MVKKIKKLFYMTLIPLIIIVGAYAIQHFKPELYQRWIYKIPFQYRIPKTYIHDDAQILTYTFEFRLNQYLDQLEQRYGIPFQVYLLPSSQGLSLQEKMRPLIEKLQSHERFGIFFLSLSDRQFKIFLSPQLSDQLKTESINLLVEHTQPALTHRQYEEGLSQFFTLFTYKLNPGDNLLPPRPSIKSSQNAKTLIFFGMAIFIFFIMGRKFLTRPRPLLKDIRKQHSGSYTRFQSFY